MCILARRKRSHVLSSTSLLLLTHCALADVHGSKFRSSSSLSLSLPASYYTGSALPVPVLLECFAPACLTLLGNGFFILPSQGSLQPADAGGWSQPVFPCMGLTHVSPLPVANFNFLWLPGAATSGTVRFDAAVVANDDPTTSYLVSACLPEAPAESSSETSMAGMVMRHHRRLAQASSDGGVVSCDSSDAVTSPHLKASAHKMTMAAMQKAWFITSGWGAPLVFAGVAVDTPPRFFAALLVSFTLAASSSASDGWRARAEAAASAPAAGCGREASPPLATLRRRCVAACSVALAAASAYGCMLLAMSYSVWVLLALAFGHGAVYIAAALCANQG